jgi:hypothetical protein
MPPVSVSIVHREVGLVCATRGSTRLSLFLSCVGWGGMAGDGILSLDAVINYYLRGLWSATATDTPYFVLCTVMNVLF